MTVPPREPSLGAQQRSALALLDSILHGITEDQLVVVHGFDRELVAGLVQTGFAIARPETIEAGGQTIEVIRLVITDVGRRALAR
jgi:hypothetical protein